MSHADINKTPVNIVRRMADRGIYERDQINAILDASPMCHVSFMFEGKPFLIPMAHWRVGNRLYIHGANKGRLIEACTSQEICVAVSHFDGFVMARSAYNHSMNYRSVVVHGRATRCDTPEEKLVHLKEFMDRHFPGRWDALRPVKANELAATVILSVEIDVAAAKVRSGPPGDQSDDPDWEVWTGIVPTLSTWGPVERDPTMAAHVKDPDYLNAYK